MGAVVTLIFLTAFSLTLGQLIVPQDIAIGQKQGTLMALTQFETKGSEAINDLSRPQEILVEGLTQTRHEDKKNQALKREFPVAATSDLLGVADVQKPTKVAKQGKPPNSRKNDMFPPLPSGVDFLSTSMSSQEIIEVPSRASRKKTSISRSWKNLVKSNPRQVGDRIDIVIEKRMNGNELSRSAAMSKHNDNKLLIDAPKDNAGVYFIEPELPWLNAAVEQTPDHTWTESTIVRSSIGPIETAEMSSHAVKVTKAKKKDTSKVNEILKTPPITLDVNSTPIEAVTTNMGKQDTHSFHLKTTDKQVQNPVTPSTVGGWSTWVEPIAADTSPAWFDGQVTVPNVPATEKPIAKTDLNFSDIQTESVATKENKSSPGAYINDLHMELPTGNDLQKSQSKGFFASWRPWTDTNKQTTTPMVKSHNDKQETVSMSPVSTTTILETREHAINSIDGDLDNQAVELDKGTMDVTPTAQTVDAEVIKSQVILQGTQALHSEIVQTDIGIQSDNSEHNKGMMEVTTMKQTVKQEVIKSQDTLPETQAKIPETVNADIGNEAAHAEHGKVPLKTVQSKLTINQEVLNNQDISQGEQTINPELVNDAASIVPGQLEVSTVSASKVLESPKLLSSNVQAQDVTEAVSSNINEPSQSTPSKISKPTTKTEEVTFPPTSNFDPLLLPPALSAVEGHVSRHEKIEQNPSSHVHSEASNPHIASSSSNNVLEQNDISGGFPDFGKSASPSKRRFFVSPSPFDLIPPEEHLHEGILHPIEPQIPNNLFDKEHSANSNTKLNEDVLNFHSHTEQRDITNSISTHGEQEQVQLKPPSKAISGDITQDTQKMKAGVNANNNWSTRSENGLAPADLKNSDQITVSDQVQERNVLLEQIREALVSLNGGPDIAKPLEGMNPLSHEPGLTHALIGSVNDLVDITRAKKEPIRTFHSKHLVSAASGGSADTDINANVDKHGAHHHSSVKHIDKNLFHYHNSLHTDPNSGHIVLDEKAIRQKLLSTDSTDSHIGHAGHDSVLGNHMGLTDSLNRADVDLSQDLSKNLMMNAPITMRNLQNRIEETNRESAKLRFFETHKPSDNIINRIAISEKSNREEKKNGKKTVAMHTKTSTPLTTTQGDDANGALSNNNSIFFDPKTHKPVDPFHNVSSDVLQKAHRAWEHAVANVKKHIDPIPEIAAVVGDKKNAIRVGSVSSNRAGETPPSSSQQPHDPNAAFHFLDPVTNAVVPIAALPETSSDNDMHSLNHHQPHLPNINEMFQTSMGKGKHPPLPFINPISSGGDMNGEDGFFVGPILFGPVDNPPPNGDIEISGPVLAMGLSTGDESEIGNHEPEGFDMKKILQGIFLANKNQHHAKKNSFKTRSPSILGLSNNTATKSKSNNSEKMKLVKSVGRTSINPLQQLSRGSTGRSILPFTHFPQESGFRHSTSTHTSEKVFDAPGDRSSTAKPRKGISKSLWNALANILKANKRKEFLSAQKAKNKFQNTFPVAITKKNLLQRPAQKQSKKPSKIDMQKIINILKARKKLFRLKKKSKAPQIKKKESAGISKKVLGGRSEIPKRSMIKPVTSPKHESISPRRSHESVSTNTDRPAPFRNNNYQLLLQLLKARRFKQNHVSTNVPSVRTNMRTSRMQTVARPAQRTIGHSSVNAGRQSFIPQLHSSRRPSAVRPIPISTIHQWPFSAPVTSHLPSMNTHFLPTYRPWPHKQIQK
ncbi:uncharacterized protein LOC117335064 isoform X2 [Pecten maximus]|uniref:uncharacterized protein LOC117335064 isoform X2 n=1 Tax=Pecten maximus TaxID=6579 RepID=UPI0014587111|nr:uncharacterized protein LOC117335064 isoform X2 [Pecten maximus]